MLDKQSKRRRRATKTRMKIRQLGLPRLCVHRSSNHTYAQIIVRTKAGDKVLVSASTLDKEVRALGGTSGDVASAGIVGTVVTQRSTKAGIKNVAFDRSGFKYHGRIKALAEAARAAGLLF